MSQHVNFVELNEESALWNASLESLSGCCDTDGFVLCSCGDFYLLEDGCHCMKDLDSDDTILSMKDQVHTNFGCITCQQPEWWRNIFCEDSDLDLGLPEDVYEI